MNITLREITPENFSAVINLEVADDQKLFVAPNVKSIAQSKIYPDSIPLAVYCEEQPVGFVMYGYDPDDEKYYLGRLMIDARHQGKGYGRAATREVIRRLSEIEGCDAVYLSFVPENTGAEKLYSSVGFERTGELNGSEIVMRYTIKNNARRASSI
ncbi:MAG TPA: GNAT family N-acetyltransferase [Pyrinomonadaceae bacterium]|nr:GNAT family N-acetyltransferase [Pyrinomonadaceae bacterium]